MNKKKESTNSLIASSSSKANGEAGSKNSTSRDRSPATSENRSEAAAQSEENKPNNGSPGQVEEDPNCCCICMINRCESDQDNEKFFRNNCGHRFCRDCWEGYLTTKIDEGAVNDIVCPQVDCFAIIPPQVVESLISKETAQRYYCFLFYSFKYKNISINTPFFFFKYFN